MSARAEAERVLVTVDGHVAFVELNRPDRHNALDPPMLDAIIAAADGLGRRTGVRAVVLHGSGRSFCSGLDVPAVVAAGGLETLAAVLDEPPPNRFQRVAHGWIDLPVPVIAAVHGHCLGGGLQLALAADIRIAAPNARLSVMEGRLGLIPDMAITRTLPRLVGIDVAKELAFTARTVSGEEAHRLGLVTHLAEDPLTAAASLATEIAGRSPDAVRRAKRLFDAGWVGTPAQTLGLEADLQRELIGTRNQLAAMAAAAGGEAAAFSDP